MPHLHTLTLAHSPDPDDVFMWWPITGKIRPDASMLSPPVIDTGPFRFTPVPADIEVLNRAAANPQAQAYDVTALSVRAYADVPDRYVITRCGASFGDGFGPKVVCRRDQSRDPHRINRVDDLAHPAIRIAIPGRRTTAFMVLRSLLSIDLRDECFIEFPFEQIIPAVARGDVDAGLVIHEGQLTFADAGLVLLADLGAWWKEKTGLVLPLGINAARRDLDARFGQGSLAFVGDLLSRSVAHAMAHRDESTAYTMPFALANSIRAAGKDAEPVSLERVDQYCRMYVSGLTADMGERGLHAIRTLLANGHSLGLCPDPGAVDLL
jgi:1,4-dihydroxy-6-naphthoate synthase